MVIGFLLVGAILALLLTARRRRKGTLAGLNASRPVFSVEPPARRHNARKHEAL